MLKLREIILLISVSCINVIVPYAMPFQPQTLEMKFDDQLELLEQVHGGLASSHDATIANQPADFRTGPQAIAYNSDGVQSEEEFQRVLENLRRVAEGTVELVTTTQASTTTRSDYFQTEPNLGQRSGEFDQFRGRRYRNNYVLFDSDLDEICEQLKLESELEEEARRERLRRDPKNIRRVEEFLQSKLDGGAKVDQLKKPTRDGRQRDDIDCLICMEPNTQQDSIKLDCDHAFHFDCLKSWFATIVDSPIKTCPICRKPYRIDVQQY